MDQTAKDVFSHEAALLSSLKSYATAYSNYQECNSSDTLGIQNPALARFGVAGSTTCTNASSVLSSATTDMSNNLVALKTAMDTYNSVATGKKTTPAFDASMVQLKGDYASMVALRANLDLKLSNLYNAESSIADMNRVETDAAVYANILWTILATSMLYVVFTKL